MQTLPLCDHFSRREISERSASDLHIDRIIVDSSYPGKQFISGGKRSIPTMNPARRRSSWGALQEREMDPPEALREKGVRELVRLVLAAPPSSLPHLPFLSFPFPFSAHDFPFSPRAFFQRHGPPAILRSSALSPSLVSSHPLPPRTPKRGATLRTNSMEMESKMEARSCARGTVVEDRLGYPTFFSFFLAYRITDQNILSY